MVRIVLSLRNHEPYRSSAQSVHRIRHTGQTQRSTDTHLTPCTVIASIATLSIYLAWSILRCLSRSLRSCSLSCFVSPEPRAGGSVDRVPLADFTEGGGT